MYFTFIYFANKIELQIIKKLETFMPVTKHTSGEEAKLNFKLDSAKYSTINKQTKKLCCFNEFLITSQEESRDKKKIYLHRDGNCN